MPSSTPERIARAFHQAYEELAPAHGYETREASAKPWEDVPEANKALMIATVGRLLERGVIFYASPEVTDVVIKPQTEAEMYAAISRRYRPNRLA